MSEIKIYNTPIEIGIRILLILKRCESAMELNSIIIYDYLMLHISDFDKKYQSLHPANPYHATELLAKRKVVQNAINLLIKKGLVNIVCSEDGIRYKDSEIGNIFLSYFESDYYFKLCSNADIVIKRFEDFNEVELNKFINNSIHNWKNENETDILFRGEFVE
ncbi:ABC-three component system middle component 2 [Clostridium sp.]|uniref:ABC-three component system middle component 2 n=1 Tax=Clostridium sp. TaxID=1506 RepID=UPI002FC85A59